MKKGTGCKTINKGGGKWQIRICTGYDGAGKKQMYRETIQLDPKKSESAQLAEVYKFIRKISSIILFELNNT